MANKTKMVHLAIEPEKFKALKEAARETDVSVSHIVRGLIKKYLESRNGR